MVSVELVTLIKTVNSVNISLQKLIFVREFAQLDIHIKILFVFLNAYQDSRIMDLVVVSNKVLFQVVHTHISINKDHAFQLVMLEPIQTVLPEFVKLVVQTVSHACHQLSVQTVTQDMI
jgi:hypothetical protein